MGALATAEVEEGRGRKGGRVSATTLFWDGSCELHGNPVFRDIGRRNTQMQSDQLYKVALATLCAVAAVLALVLMVRGLFSGASTLVSLVAGG